MFMKFSQASIMMYLYYKKKGETTPKNTWDDSHFSYLPITESSINKLLEILVISQLIEATGFLHRIFEIRVVINGFL